MQFIILVFTVNSFTFQKCFPRKFVGCSFSTSECCIQVNFLIFYYKTVYYSCTWNWQNPSNVTSLPLKLRALNAILRIKNCFKYLRWSSFDWRHKQNMNVLMLDPQTTVRMVPGLNQCFRRKLMSSVIPTC